MDRKASVRHLRDTAIRLLEIAADMEDGTAGPDEELTTRGGESLGVTLAELTDQQLSDYVRYGESAAMVEERGDMPGILGSLASTFGGRP